MPNFLTLAILCYSTLFQTSWKRLCPQKYWSLHMYRPHRGGYRPKNRGVQVSFITCLYTLGYMRRANNWSYCCRNQGPGPKSSKDGQDNIWGLAYNINHWGQVLLFLIQIYFCMKYFCYLFFVFHQIKTPLEETSSLQAGQERWTAHWSTKVPRWMLGSDWPQK